MAYCRAGTIKSVESECFVAYQLIRIIQIGFYGRGQTGLKEAGFFSGNFVWLGWRLVQTQELEEIYPWGRVDETLFLMVLGNGCMFSFFGKLSVGFHSPVIINILVECW